MLRVPLYPLSFVPRVGPTFHFPSQIGITLGVGPCEPQAKSVLVLLERLPLPPIGSKFGQLQKFHLISEMMRLDALGHERRINRDRKPSGLLVIGENRSGHGFAS